MKSPRFTSGHCVATVWPLCGHCEATVWPLCGHWALATPRGKSTTQHWKKRLVVKSSDSGLPKSCTTFQTHIPFTPAASIGKHLAAKKHGAHVSKLGEGVQRGAAEKWCRIMAIHRLNFFGPKVLKTVLETSCWCLRHENDPERWSARPRARPRARPGARVRQLVGVGKHFTIHECTAFLNGIL